MQRETPTYFEIRAFVTQQNGTKPNSKSFESVSIIECQLTSSDAKGPTNSINSIESSTLLAYLEVLLTSEGETGRQTYYTELNKIRDNPTIVAIRPLVDAFSTDTPRLSYHLRTLIIGTGPSVKPWKIGALTEAIEICIKCLSVENLKPELAQLPQEVFQ